MKIRCRGTVIFLAFFLGFTLFAGQSVIAQERDIVRISNVSGNDFSITMYGERMAYTQDEVNRGRVSLENPGIVHTGGRTSIEITLVPSGTVIRMSENSSLIYNGFDASGNFEDFGLLYGRIRVDAQNRTRPIVIRGGRAAARFFNGSFGIDHLLEANEWTFATQPQLRLNSFQGQAEFYLGGPGSQDALDSQRQTVTEGESISIAGIRPLDADSLAYWEHQAPGGGGGETRVNPFLSPDGSTGSYRGKNITLGIGLFLTAVSAAALMISHPQFNIISNNDFARNINFSSYIPLGMGLATTLGGIMYNPSRQ